jgi:hypothetical protein
MGEHTEDLRLLGRLSENTLNEVIKRLHERSDVPSDVPGRPAVVHGMRSTLRNWGRERTDFSPELLELALAHTVGNAAERAYARDDGLEQRRTIMVAWAAFVSKPDKGWPKTWHALKHPHSQCLRQQLARVLEEQQQLLLADRR